MKAKVDDSIPYQYATARSALENSYQNPLGAHTSPATRDAARRAGGQALGMAERQAQLESQYNADNANYGRQATVAQMTAPQLVQTGGTQTTGSGLGTSILTAGIGLL